MKPDISDDQVLLGEFIKEVFKNFEEELYETKASVHMEEVGHIVTVGHAVAKVKGLPHVQAGEILQFENNLLAMAFELDMNHVGCVLMDPSKKLTAGSEVRRTKNVLEVPVGSSLLGRIVDGIGRPKDAKGAIDSSHKRPIEREAPPIMDRAPVSVPLQTGIKVIDALLPIGRGQRELIMGDRQTGKTAMAIDTILNQKNSDVICIYCAIGKRSSAIASVVETLHEHKAFEYCCVIATSENDPPGLQYAAPYSAMAIGEHFMEDGRDVLVVFDDLTRHARAYRELSLLLGRPPGREAYPGDIFYIHSRLLERATHLKKELAGGSLTALPIVETQAQDISAYIPTNLISITDGQIYLSPELFQKGILPAVDVGESVSRVGGKAQLPAYRKISGDLRLTYSQFEELESFARFGTRLDEKTREQLERGYRVREILKQEQYKSLSPAEQIMILFAIKEGHADHLSVEAIPQLEDKILKVTSGSDFESLRKKIEAGEQIDDSQWKSFNEALAIVTEEMEATDADY